MSSENPLSTTLGTMSSGPESLWSYRAMLQPGRLNYARKEWKYLLHSCPTLLALFPISSKTRFRWFQESSVHRDAPPFALDGVYISEPCPNHCGGHGDCISGVCFCDMGYTGKAPERWFVKQKVAFLHVIRFNCFPTVEQDSCVPSVVSPTELTEGFEGKLSPLWQSLSGGQIGGGCGIISEGKALYFSSPGRREARTVPLDTSNTRWVVYTHASCIPVV